MRYGIILFILAAGLFFLWINKEHPSPQQQLTTTPTAAPVITPEVKTIQSKSETYVYEIIGPINPERVTLYSNLPDKKSSSELKNIYSCQSLTSAGFYGTNDQHIGLFLVDDVIIQEQSQNAFFNAFIWNTRKNVAGIGQVLPDNQLSFAIQTGPLLITENSARQLSLTVDEEARRIALGVTENNSIVFYVVHKPGNTFSGPTLANLPEIIHSINSQENLSIPTAINLDGGNHSTFRSPTNSISELSAVGGIFCIK